MTEDKGFSWLAAIVGYYGTTQLGPRRAGKVILLLLVWFVAMFFTYGSYVMQQRESYNKAMQVCLDTFSNECVNNLATPSTPLWLQLLVIGGWALVLFLTPKRWWQ